ncbi:MAG: hypothetical protein RLZZ546_789, partial [Bacteroidota bacterium]
QDLLITGGLAIEAVVFAASAIKFVEVKKDSQVATEATLSKVADGLGQIASNSSLIGGGGNGETYINIQTSAADGPVSGNTNTNTSSLTNFSDKKLSIDINPNTITSHTLWQLEQLDILSLAKDLFFQPKWDELSADEYNQLTQLFKVVFDKKLPNKEALLFLVQFPVKLPIPELNKLTIDKEHSLELSDIELLCKAFTLINFNTFFDNFILELNGESCTIRPKKVGDIQVYGGEIEDVITHINNYFDKELIVSPNVECLQSVIKLKGQSLLEFFIQKVDIKNEAELSSLITLLEAQSDELKSKLWSKFKKIKYNIVSNEGYNYLKLLVQSALSFNKSSSGAQIFDNIIEFQVSDSITITLNDVVNYTAETIYFGPKNEYSVHLKELFTNGELEHLFHVQSIIDKLVLDNVTSKSKLLQLFNLNEHDTKKEVFDKLNYHLTKTNTSPSGAQLAFVLLYKQYSNS